MGHIDGFKNIPVDELREQISEISMCPDEKGFLYPLVNSGKCIRCYKCEQICPFKKR